MMTDCSTHTRKPTSCRLRSTCPQFDMRIMTMLNTYHMHLPDCVVTCLLEFHFKEIGYILLCKLGNRNQRTRWLEIISFSESKHRVLLHVGVRCPALLHEYCQKFTSFRTPDKRPNTLLLFLSSLSTNPRRNLNDHVCVCVLCISTYLCMCWRTPVWFQFASWVLRICHRATFE